MGIQEYAQAGGSNVVISEIQALTYTTQVVAGTNYLVTAKINGEQRIDVTIYEPISGDKQVTNFAWNYGNYGGGAPGGAFICGAAAPERDAEEGIQAMLEEMKDLIQEAAQAGGWNGVISEIQALTYTTQVVNGINYFVKAKLNGEQFIHISIYEKVPG